jgi:hypothetical protein
MNMDDKGGGERDERKEGIFGVQPPRLVARRGPSLRFESTVLQNVVTGEMKPARTHVKKAINHL